MELHYMEGYIRGVMSEMTLLLNVLAECLLHMIGRLPSHIINCHHYAEKALIMHRCYSKLAACLAPFGISCLKTSGVSMRATSRRLHRLGRALDRELMFRLLDYKLHNRAKALKRWSVGSVSLHLPIAKELVFRFDQAQDLRQLQPHERALRSKMKVCY